MMAFSISLAHERKKEGWDTVRMGEEGVLVGGEFKGKSGGDTIMRGGCNGKKEP